MCAFVFWGKCFQSTLFELKIMVHFFLEKYMYEDSISQVKYMHACRFNFLGLCFKQSTIAKTKWSQLLYRSYISFTFNWKISCPTKKNVGYIWIMVLKTIVGRRYIRCVWHDGGMHNSNIPLFSPFWMVFHDDKMFLFCK